MIMSEEAETKNLCLLLLLLLQRSYAINTIISTPPATDGSLTVCPGELITFTCTHGNDETATHWQLPGVADDQLCVILYESTEVKCDPFIVTNISNITEPTLSSTVHITSDNIYNGSVIACLKGPRSTSPQIGNITITIQVFFTPSLMVKQTSQYSIEVKFSVSNARCVASYQVLVTQEGDNTNNTNVSSPSPTLQVDGLDLCQYNYTVVGSTQSNNGAQSELSSPVSFSANLSNLNGVRNVKINCDQEEFVVKWTQEANHNYQTCVSGYILSWNGKEQRVFNTSTTRADLSEISVPYCSQSISLTVTPFTPLKILTTVSRTTIVDLAIPGFVSPNISGVYTLNTDTTVTVTDKMKSNQTIIFIGKVQAISGMDHMYGINCDGSTCIADVTFTDSEFEATLPSNASFGDTCTICVVFINSCCIEKIYDTILIPGDDIILKNRGTPFQAGYVVTLDLPITAYHPDQLSIISAVSPNDIPPVIADFPSSYQYTLTFTGLNPGENYTYTVRIVRRDNHTIQVHSTLTRSFTTVEYYAQQPTTTSDSEGACKEICVIAIAVVFTALVVIAIFIGVILLQMNKKRIKLFAKASSVKFEMEIHKSGLQSDNSKPTSISDTFKINEQNAVPDNSSHDQYPGFDVPEPTYAVADTQRVIVKKGAGDKKLQIDLTTTNSPYVEIGGHQHDTQVYVHVTVDMSQQTHQVSNDALEVQYAVLDYSKLTAKEDLHEVQNDAKEKPPALPRKPIPFITETLHALLTPAADKWYEIGLAMGFSQYTLESEIYPGNSTDWLRLGEVCILYCLHKHTWEEVVRILWEVEEWEIADKICRQERLEVEHPVSQMDYVHPPSLPPKV